MVQWFHTPPKCGLGGVHLECLNPDKDFILLQDGDTSHTCRATQTLLSTNDIDFIKKYEWPPLSPYQNLIDRYEWISLNEEVYTNQ